MSSSASRVHQNKGQSEEAPTHSGHGLKLYIASLLARTDGQPVSVEVLDQLTSANRVALVLREVVSRGDASLDLRRVNVYEVVDGKITRIDVFEANQYEVDEFFT